MNKKQNINECANILTQMSSTIIGDKKNEMLKITIEECRMGDDDIHNNNLHGLFFKSA